MYYAHMSKCVYMQHLAETCGSSFLIVSTQGY
jgi:hypothetical protein